MTKYILEINQLNSGILKDVSFQWEQGETIALMGPNGSGKSTLARVLVGLKRGFDEHVRLYQNDNRISWDEVHRWSIIGLVGQHPRRQCIGATIGEEVGFGLISLGYSPKKIKEEIKKTLVELKLEGRENQSPSTLSGGERQRLVIGAVLAVNPTFLILDEAFSMLDQKARSDILRILKEKKGRVGQLWITHDRDLALEADRILLLKDGKLTDGGKPENVLNNQRICEEFGLEFPYCYEPQMIIEEKLDREKGCKEKTIAGRIIERNTISEQVSKEEIGRNPVIEWDKAIFGEDRRLVVDKKLWAGQFIGILGPSGSGKTTLLESVVGLILPAEGKVTVLNNTYPLSKNGIKNLRQKIRMVLQEGGEFLYGRRVEQIVFNFQSKEEMLAKSKENQAYLERWGLDKKKDLAPERLSGGERQLVALAMAFSVNAPILLLDEPLLGLDRLGKEKVFSFLREQRGKTILYVTHQLKEILPFADRLWLVEKGRITLDCSIHEWQEHADQLNKAGVKIG